MRFKLNQAHITVAITAMVFILLFLAGAMRYRGFFTATVFLNLLKDNAFLGITAIGMTFVILSGGIDLSVGSVIGFTGILVATLVEKQHMHPAIVIPLVLLMGALFGLGMGCLIHYFELAPFLVTLAGMFLARGLGLMISQESIPLAHPFFNLEIPCLGSIMEALGLPFTGGMTELSVLLFLACLLGAIALSSYTSFGRNVYAIGGNEQSATLMGLPVGLTKLGVYTLSGFCSALAGIVYTVMYTRSGNASAAVGLELDAIAAVVIGGTLLTGGVGHVAGTLIGVLILGIIQTAITFEGTLSSWWTKIVIGLLLFVFVVLQRFLVGAIRKTLRATQAARGFDVVKPAQ